MARAKKRIDDDEPESATTDSKAEPVDNWADKPDSDPYQDALKLYTLVQKSYDNKDEQADRIEEYWNIHSAVPDDNQQYNGNSTGYIPAVRDAINARTKRALKQLFPQNNKHVEGLSSDGHTPFTQLSLLEHYIRKTKLKSTVRSDLIAGDVTGQWNLRVDWTTSERSVTRLVKRNPIMQQLDGENIADLEIEDTSQEDEDTEQEDIIEETPEVVDFATEDLAVVPPTCVNLQKAKAVATRLRMSADKVREMVDEGVFILPADTDIEDFCKVDQSRDRKSPPKKQTSDAGVKTYGTDKYALIYEVYTKLDFGGEHRESGIIYYAAPTVIVGIIKNPLWSGKIPIISEPVERMQGSFFGKSKIEPVKFLQWNLNDFFNMGVDSAQYSLLPIWAVDPLKTPQWANLTMGLAAIWPVSPADVKPITSPQLWKDSAAFCDVIKKQIWESLDVNPGMMGQMPQGRKNAQMMGKMQQEQEINITDHASRYEDVVLNPLVEMLFEFDQQFRDGELMIESRGEIGVKAKMETIPVQQWGERYFFRWSGTSFMVGMQLMQQQTGWVNVLKGIPPQMLGGLTLDLTPFLMSGTENMFGPEIAPRILIDKRNQYKIDPEVENEILANGMPVEVHEADEDPEHLQAHMKAASMNGDILGLYKAHMQMHMMQMQKKREMQMAQQKPPGAPGGPGGGGPGVAGGPKPGAMPGPPRPGGQQPPGAVHSDQMADPMAVPRG